jgi:hypothetical protein
MGGSPTLTRATGEPLFRTMPMQVPRQSMTPNLPYDLSDENWGRVAAVYRNMEGWIESTDVPRWFGNEDGPKQISASVEPSGLLLEGRLESDAWAKWIDLLSTRLSAALGFKVRDAES